MSSEKRLTTDRFYGGTEQPLSLLAQFLSYIRSESPTEAAAKNWLLSFTPATSADATSRHLRFLEAIELIEIDDAEVSVGRAGHDWLETLDERGLFEALNRNVAGFESLLLALAEAPRSDEELRTTLNSVNAFDMDGPGVAVRHREWLEVLGYVTRTDGTTQLTDAGQSLVDEFHTTTDESSENVADSDDLQPVPSFEVGQRYDRRAIHDAYGGQRYRGIATPAETDAVFLFTGDSGADYGYADEFRDDGTFIYTGEGREGDMTMDGGNKAIRSHRAAGDELHLFENTDEAWIVEYLGEFKYVDHRIEQLPDENDDLRDAIRFVLEPVDTGE